MLFPELRDDRFGFWNSNQMALERDKNGLSSERLLVYARRLLNVDHLIGGWMENRSYTLRGTYLEPETFLHLGMDFFIPQGTLVTVTNREVVVQIFCDLPEKYGWGTRVITKLLDYDSTYLVYGHLTRNGNHVKLGSILKPDDIIGSIGSRNENGGWAPHLHIQAITGNIDDIYHKPDILDGYGKLSEQESLMIRFPDPMKYLKLNLKQD